VPKYLDARHYSLEGAPPAVGQLRQRHSARASPHGGDASLTQNSRARDSFGFIENPNRGAAAAAWRGKFRIVPDDAQSMIPKSGYRFPAFAKPAWAGEGRSEKIMLNQKARARF
jgi:hypothetical protein